MLNLAPNTKVEDLDKAGVYKITNSINSKFYIGCTGKKGFKSRWGCRYNEYLERSFKKYGKENFVYEILLICAPENAVENEQKFLDLLQPWADTGVGYNFCKTGNLRTGYKTSEETKEKQRQVKLGKKRSPETIEKMRLGHIGIKHSAETKAKWSAQRKGKKRSPLLPKKIGPMTGKTHTDAVKERLRQVNTGKKYSPEVNKKKGSKTPWNKGKGDTSPEKMLERRERENEMQRQRRERNKAEAEQRKIKEAA